MADAIPVSDPGLLAAQAKAGQAGVDAYNAAISTLQAQKQQAVQTALQEAALRGSPQGAAESQSSIISTPYDQRIASLTQGLGSYQASQAARETRTGAYNMGVQAARSYIPQQVEMVVAPIRARADFEVRNTEMEGRQRTSAIEADTDLTLARMRANLQAAQIAEAKRKAEEDAEEMKLTQGELTGFMTDRAAQQLQGSGDQISQILSANEATTLQRAADATAANKAKEEAIAAPVRNQNYWDLMGAAYTGKGIKEYQGKKPLPFQPTGAVPLPMQVPPQQAGLPSSGNNNVLGRSASGFPLPAGRPAVPNQQGFDGAARFNAINEQARQMRAPAGIAAGRQSIDNLARGVAERQGKVGRDLGVSRLQAALGSLDKSNNEFAAIDSETGRRVFMTPAQLGGLDPFSQEMVRGATQFQGINGLEDFQNIVMGTPTDPNDPDVLNGLHPDNRGMAPNSYSSDVVRNAMTEVARKLQLEGYQINDADLANAMPTKGTSIYNLLAERAGQKSSEDVYKSGVDARDAAIAAQEKADKQLEEDKKAGTEEQEAGADEDLMAAYHRLPPSEIGTSYQVQQQLLGNADNVQALGERVNEIIKGWDTTRGAISASQVYTQLMQQPDLSAADQALIPLVLYIKGL